MKKFNDWLALHITAVISTMWTSYLFTLLALVSLPASIKSHQPVIIVAWIAQTFLQLVLLPIIMVGQKLQAETTIKHVNKKHEELKKHLTKIGKKS